MNLRYVIRNGERVLQQGWLEVTHFLSEREIHPIGTVFPRSYTPMDIKEIWQDIPTVKEEQDE